MTVRGCIGLAALLYVGALMWAEEPETVPPAPDVTFVDGGGEEGEARPSPFAEAGEDADRKDAAAGYIELSTGMKIPGRVFTTRAKRLKIFNLEKEIDEYVPVPAIARLEAVVEWERMEPEWRFKEAGSPEKVLTGRSYPARKLAYRLTLLNGHRITGHLLGQPLYAALEDGRVERFVLHDRQKGPLDARLEDLVYVKSVALGREAYETAVSESKSARPESPAEGSVVD